MLTPTQSEFDNLPATVQRKYFSTLERLRYAEAQAHAQARATAVATQVPLASQFSPKRLLPTGNALTRIKNSVQPSRLLQRSSTRHAPNNLTCSTVTQQDALWYSRLPEKIQRGQFSIEEQILLTGRKEDVILDAADEKFYQLGEKINRSLPSLSSLYTGPSSPDSFDTDEDGCSSVFEEDLAMDSKDMLDSFRWMDTDLDLSLDDYHIHLAETVDSKLDGSKHHPLLQEHGLVTGVQTPKERRSSSFASRKSIENWGNSWAPAPAPPPPLPRLPSTPHVAKQQARRESSSTTRAAPEQWATEWPLVSNPPAARPSLDGASTTVEPGATHYLNPEARLKLKLYLASPSKFDEALEFGFPSLQSIPSTRPSTAPRRPSLSTSRSAHQLKARPVKDFSGSPTFLDDSTTTTGSVDPSNPSVRLDLSSRSTTPRAYTAYDQVSSLATPFNPSMDSFEPSSLSSSQPTYRQEEPEPSQDFQSQFRQIDREPYLRALPGREMTLRMTLTRSDLRADDAEIYPNPPPLPASRPNVLRRTISQTLGRSSGQGGNDLLKLEELQLGDDAAAVMNGKERPSGLRRFLTRK